jgi:L,D-peptidoglycan transpeptidase YkuD (ErfK/YbiS/YcfS/YnhG family)
VIAEDLLIRVDASGRLELPDGRALACVLGKGGVRPAAEKREGDGATPAGRWPLRRVFYRPDRELPPATALDRVPLKPRDGWCDDPAHPLYNRPVTLPFAASHEVLWREDHIYDLIVELGHNDDPPVPGLGSAIFMHLTRPDRAPTEGCVALERDGLLTLLAHCRPGAVIEIG